MTWGHGRAFWRPPHGPGESKYPRLHLVVDAFGNDGGALVEIHFGVALFDRHPAFGGGTRVRRLRAATGKRSGGEDEHRHGNKIAGVWGRSHVR